MAELTWFLIGTLNTACMAYLLPRAYRAGQRWSRRKSPPLVNQQGQPLLSPYRRLTPEQLANLYADIQAGMDELQQSGNSSGKAPPSGPTPSFSSSERTPWGLTGDLRRPLHSGNPVPAVTPAGQTPGVSATARVSGATDGRHGSKASKG